MKRQLNELEISTAINECIDPIIQALRDEIYLDWVIAQEKYMNEVFR